MTNVLGFLYICGGSFMVIYYHEERVTSVS